MNVFDPAVAVLFKRGYCLETGGKLIWFEIIWNNCSSLFIDSTIFQKNIFTTVIACEIISDVMVKH